MPRFPTVQSAFFLKLLSWDERFRTRAAVATLLEQYASRSGLTMLGFSAPRRLLREIALSEIPDLFKPEASRNSHDFLFGEPRLSLNVTWEDSDWAEVTDSVRVGIMARIEEDDPTFSQRQFRLLCELTGAFWGELNETSVTENVTFSGLNEHAFCLPLFGTMNYLGPDYVAYLGRRNLSEAGFNRIEGFGEGLLTSVTAATPQAFAERQHAIREQLGGDRVFKDWRPDNGPHFVTRDHHVGRYRASVPPMEFVVTAKGLKKKPLKTKKTSHE